MSERNEEPRAFTVGERRQRFLAYKQNLAANSDSNVEGTRWYTIDDPLTPRQYDEIPAGRPGISDRTQPLWVKYRHNLRRELVVAEGYFDHEDARWIARYEPEDNGDHVLQVQAIAWRHIKAGVKPWDGPIILRRSEKAQ